VQTNKQKQEKIKKTKIENFKKSNPGFRK